MKSIIFAFDDLVVFEYKSLRLHIKAYVEKDIITNIRVSIFYTLHKKENQYLYTGYLAKEPLKLLNENKDLNGDFEIDLEIERELAENANFHEIICEAFKHKEVYMQRVGDDIMDSITNYIAEEYMRKDSK